MSVIVISIIIMIVILCVVLPSVIGNYVYKDAKRRNMNSVLWMLLSVFAPGFIGLIIYLIVRSDRALLSCPKCGKNVSENFAVCPGCGFSLKNTTCPTCGRSLEHDWNICPSCANPVPEEMKIKKPAKPRKDKGLTRILLLVILIPVLLCLFIIAGMFMFTAKDNGVESVNESYIDPQTVCCYKQDIDEKISDCNKKVEIVCALKPAEINKITEFVVPC